MECKHCGSDDLTIINGFAEKHISENLLQSTKIVFKNQDDVEIRICFCNDCGQMSVVEMCKDSVYEMEG